MPHNPNTPISNPRPRGSDHPDHPDHPDIESQKPPDQLPVQACPIQGNLSRLLILTPALASITMTRTLSTGAQ